MPVIKAMVGGSAGDTLVFTGGSVPLRAADSGGIVKRFIDFLAQVKATAPRASLNGMKPTFEKSKVYCPHDTGALRDSAYLELRGQFDVGSGSASEASVEIGYGKHGNPPYALIVHEMVQYHHAPPTRAKFLQSAIEEDMDKILPYIADHLKA